MKRQTSESIEIGILLALAGGFMDSYSYICRGGVFANAQTGNMLLFGINLANGNITKSISYATTILFFGIGIIMSNIIRHIMEKIDKKNYLHWRQIVLLIEMILFVIVCFISKEHNMLANNITSMGCGIQMQSFRKIYDNNIATTMCIGNFRSATDNMYSFFKNRKISHLKKSLLYYFIISCFISGAIIGNFFIKIMSEKAMLICVAILFISFIMMFKKERKIIVNI